MNIYRYFLLKQFNDEGTGSYYSSVVAATTADKAASQVATKVKHLRESGMVIIEWWVISERKTK